VESNNRQQQRRTLRCPAVVKWADGSVTHTHTIDVCSAGVSVSVQKAVPGSGLCDLSFVVLLRTGARKFNVKCDIIHCILCGVEGFRVGLRFRDLDEVGHQQLDELCKGHDPATVQVKVFS
jgi:hypothetical protein